MKKIKIGFAPTRRSIFSAPDAIKYRGLTAKRLEELGVDFVDISTLLTENGCLADKYCSDPESGGCHLNDSGCLVWTGLLRNYAAKKLAGVYKNPESMPTLSKG